MSLARAAVQRRSPGGPAAVSPHRSRWDRAAAVVLVTALVSAGLAVTLSRTVFSRLSVNGDEAVYLLQARAFAHGHLFPPAPHPAGSFTPWLAVIHGDHYVVKYTPVVAGFFAASLLLTGGYVFGLAVLAAALVVVTFLLAAEVTGNRPVAATAAVLMAASPVVIVQQALVLPYVLFLVLAQLSLWALLAGARQGRARLLAVAGLLGAIAFAARTLDALLVLGPAVVFVLWRGRHRLRLAASLSAGAVLPLAGLLWFDDAATGSPLRLPFSLFESGDTLGFGVHRLYPGEVGRRFGLIQGLRGIGRHLELLGSGWAFGGLILLALAVVALVRRRASPELLVVLAGGLLLVCGYLFFWGTWNAAIVWGAVRYLGPYYLLPLLIPLCILAALGLAEIATAGSWRAASAVGLAAVVSGVALVPALRSDLALRADNAQLARAVSDRGRALVFVDTYPSYLQHPTSVIANNFPVGGRTVFALPRGGDDFSVLRSFPGRALYRLRLLGEYGKLPHARYGAQLEHVHLVRGRTLTFTLSVRLPARVSAGTVEVLAGRVRYHWVLRGSRPGTFRFVVASSSLPRGTDGSITASVSKSPGHVLDHLLIPLAADQGGMLSALVPSGVVAELGPLPAPPLSVTAD